MEKILSVEPLRADNNLVAHNLSMAIYYPRYQEQHDCDCQFLGTAAEKMLYVYKDHVANLYRKSVFLTTYLYTQLL